MSPGTANLAFFAFIAFLFYLDRAGKARTSTAVWLPAIWLSIGGSRMVSVWFDVKKQASVDEVIDGSPMDRNLLLGLTVLGAYILFQRKDRVTRQLTANKAFLVFLAYCAVSILWSDYPFVAFKRLIKTGGDLVMALLVLTDDDPIAALKRMLARIGFILMPCSILLIRYYSEIGRGFDKLTGEPTVFGVTTGKNLLGMICMIGGVGAVWRLSMMFAGPKEERPLGSVAAQCILLSMVALLFYQADSVTSMMCFVIASSIIVGTAFGVLTWKPWVVHAISIFMLCGASFVLLGGGGALLELVGRNPTLTGRTEIWSVVGEFAGSPWIGTGYDSFWLGTRLEAMWARYWWHPNEAHSGYVEMFLNLGIIGLTCFASALIGGYRNIIAEYRRNPLSGSFALGFFIATLIYNVTETAIRNFHPLWGLLLLTVVGAPRAVSQMQSAGVEAPAAAPVEPLPFRLAPRTAGVSEPLPAGSRYSFSRAR